MKGQKFQDQISSRYRLDKRNTADSKQTGEMEEFYGCKGWYMSLSKSSFPLGPYICFRIVNRIFLFRGWCLLCALGRFCLPGGRFCSSRFLILECFFPLPALLDTALKFNGRLNLLTICPPNHHFIFFNGHDPEDPFFVFVLLVDNEFAFSRCIHFPSISPKFDGHFAGLKLTLFILLAIRFFFGLYLNALWINGNGTPFSHHVIIVKKQLDLTITGRSE